MGVFGFVQRKIEDKILDEIALEIFTTHYYLLISRKIDCHLGKGGQHNFISGHLLDKKYWLAFHFCEGVGFFSLSSKGTYTWLEAPWLTADIKKSAREIDRFVDIVLKKLESKRDT
jgi:hypothetical protein